MARNFKPDPFATARQFVHDHFPYCDGVILSGSIIQGNATSTSDLDVIIFDRNVPSSFRESFLYHDWPMEIFVHNLTSYKQIFITDYERAIPTLPTMISEGKALFDLGGIISSIKLEANQLLQAGPEPWSKKTINMKRYFITDVLNDFIDAEDRGEEVVIANTLLQWLQEFFLRTNGNWIGEAKWIIRTLRKYDAPFATKYVESFDSFYRTGNKEPIITLADQILAPYGGRLFHGFSMGEN
ncbi:nucleotidyltransferase domain-containing protein [Evansella tamaricis]|uniref:nucleotidyltransferase domain-containing protein n=1 Tax=Evansella tamaricis TaxID=2069301 RepID=UPI001FE86F87|nr:nucleotidyltransferase domain-containing protein [Evansella tamaricis]